MTVPGFPTRPFQLTRPCQLTLLASLMLVALSSCTTVVPGRPTAALSLVRPEQLCPGTGSTRDAAAALVSCIADDVSAYWTSALDQPVQSPIGIAPDPAAVAEDCRAFLAFGTAFYCPPDATIYITAALLDRYALGLGDGLPYGLAFLVGHELGHVVQHIVNQPALNITEPSYSDLRGIEQQADCLAGVWASHAAGAGQINPSLFRDVAGEELRIISRIEPPPGVGLDDYDEVATHGNVEERLAAFDRGLAGETGGACRLVAGD